LVREKERSNDMLSKLKVIRKFITEAEGDENLRLEAMRAIGTIEGLLNFEATLLEGIKSEVANMLGDIRGDEVVEGGFRTKFGSKPDDIIYD
jgi:hypothetical protein